LVVEIGLRVSVLSRRGLLKYSWVWGWGWSGIRDGELRKKK